MYFYTTIATNIYIVQPQISDSTLNENFIFHQNGACAELN